MNFCTGRIKEFSPFNVVPMTMTSNEKRMLEREALRSVIQQWNANRLDLFELSEPDENLQFHGVMRFYFQDHGQKVATKCIRVASDATVSDVIETLIEKFRPDMRMLSLPSYALYETHSNGEDRKLNPDEKPLLVQLNWHIDDREGRFLLRDTMLNINALENPDINFKRKLSKREKKEQKKKEKLAKLNSNPAADTENHVAEKLYNELPETSFTRSISNPEAVMRRRRQQILEKKLQQFRSRDGGPDTGGTLKIYGESLCQDVPYKTLLLSIRDCAQAVVREMLAKYGLESSPLNYCLVQVNSDGTEYILDDDECPLSILMNHPTSRGSIMFHVRRRPADSQPRRRKKKPLGVQNGSNNVTVEREGPMLVEITHSGDGGRRVKLTAEPVEVGSANTNPLQLFGPSIQPRHCLISLHEGVCTVTPLHADALTFVNGHHIQQPTILHNGSVVMFGRVASYRFVDSQSDGRFNLALSQSQLDSACLYESRTATSPSWHEEDRFISPAHNTMGTSQVQKPNYLESDTRSLSIDGAADHGKFGYTTTATTTTNNNNQFAQSSLGHRNNNEPTTQSNDTNNKNLIVDDKQSEYEHDANTETETKSVSSQKSDASNPEASRTSKMQPTEISGQEPILPAVLEFPETYQDAFLSQVISELDVNVPNFKLAPVYTLYLCARYRASTHYRPDLQPTERAHKLTIFLHNVANIIYSIVQEQYQDPKILSFWMANSSEFLHFLKSDRHISAFSVQAQEILTETVQNAFRNLVNCFRSELSQTLTQFLTEHIDHDSAAGLVLTVLGSVMALLRRCRVNAALTIQLFSQLFHYINCICFNKIVTNPHMCIEHWGKVISERLRILEVWALRQGLELAAECHLSKINQCADFLMASKSNVTEVQNLACRCFRLNSFQMAALLSQEKIPKNLVDTAIRMAESVADELARGDGREVTLEESTELPLALLIPEDGFSCDVVRGIPPGLVDFVSPLQAAGMCRLAAQPTSIGLWTVYMHQYNQRSTSAMSSKHPQPEIQQIKLHKNSNGMGLSIVAAKGAGQERLGIYIKSVVPGGAADADGYLQAGDQLLKVDGQSLIGITQERAADYLVRTGQVVTLEVAKQGAIYHGLATLLQQPSPVIQRGNRRVSERDMSRIGADMKPPLPMHAHQLPNSKSTPALHHVGNQSMASNKSRSIHNLTGNVDHSFYQNLSACRAQNQSQPNLGERSQIATSQSTINSPTTSTLTSMNQTTLNRPTSAYFSSNNTSNFMPSSQHQQPTQQNTMPYIISSQQQTQQQKVDSLHQQQQQQQDLDQHQQQQQQQNGPIIPGNLSGQTMMMNSRQTKANFHRDNQSRMNQIMAPSMPNIAHSSFASNISASQSMQNVNMINPYNPLGHSNLMQQQINVATSHPHIYQQDFQLQSHLLQQQQLNQATLMRGKLNDMNEMLKRRNQRQQEMMPMHSLDGSEQISPVKQLPPTAPKPQNLRQTQMFKEELSPPLPPTATHPLFTPTSSAGQNPAMNQNLNAFGAAPQPQPQKQFHGSNPWEREEREKEQQLRRDQVRQWRDLQISELSGQQHRTHSEDEQLKALVLERDFERRAQETDEQDDNNSFGKDNIVEVVRLSQGGGAHLPITTTLTTMKQADIKSIVPNNDNSSEMSSFPNYPAQHHGNIQPKSILKHNSNRNEEANSSSPSSPSKQAKSTSFAADDRLVSESSISHMARDLSNLSFNNYDSKDVNDQFDIISPPTQPARQITPPPPPPERNSSYAVMSQKQQQTIRSSLGGPVQSSIEPQAHVTPPMQQTKILNYMNTKRTVGPSMTSTSNNNNNNQPNMPVGSVTQMSLSAMMANRDNKRVSFHDDDNNFIETNPMIPEEAELDIIRDSNRYIQESMDAMSPTTPESELWNSSMQPTPGVIGAQEVYRDPRTRRLREKQQQQQQRSGEVPEKLSFKEKMKMFALESGENQTPKDKLKISRAQRDIDAVH
ncbi:afadin isoform X3 [Bradysia coprophila]|uniref:afadin isoform X3 n=1 Tax=Bradysia coprophila TaxID=38358 RepID=UPI00187DC777|nr:afadin isoform X3 [Bradysia coprophila]